MAVRAIGVNDFVDKEFKTYAFTGEWADHMGIPEQNFKILVYGHPKNGKTEYAIKLTKYLASFGKADYFSFEQGISKTLQDAIKRNEMSSVAGKAMFLGKCTFDDVMKRLKQKGSARFVILDSRDYMNLTVAQWQELTAAFPRKAFILICWEASGKPKGDHAQSIEYQVDIKVHVRNFIAHPTSRFGGNQDYTIWDKKKAPGAQLTLL